MTLVYSRLDKLVIAARKKQVNPPTEKYKRINLSRPRTTAPDSAVYPFMVSNAWSLKYPLEAANVVVRSKNPPGFANAQTDLSEHEGTQAD